MVFQGLKKEKKFESVIPIKGNIRGRLMVGLTSQMFPVRLQNVVDPGYLTIVRTCLLLKTTKKLPPTLHTLYSSLPFCGTMFGMSLPKERR